MGIPGWRSLAAESATLLADRQVPPTL